MTWSENCVLTDIKIYATVPVKRDDPPKPAINAPANATFVIIDTKLYLTVVTLSIQDDKNLLEQLKTKFGRTIKWNKYRSEMSNQTKINNRS